MPRKDKVTYIPLLEILIGKEFEEELLKLVLPYRDKAHAQQRTGRVFREALQNHIWDSNFPRVVDSPDFRLLPILKEQWLTAHEFSLVVLWLWKHENGETIRQASEWLSSNHPDSGELYKAEKNNGEIENTLTQWAETLTPPPEKPDKTKLALALSLYTTLHPDIFQPFETNEKRPSQREAHNMAQPKDSLWESIIKQLKKEPADRFNMADFEEFTHRAQVIVRQKTEEHERTQKLGVLAAQIKEVRYLLTAWESYFNITTHLDWEIDALTKDAREAIPEKFNELQNQIDRLGNLLKSQPSSRDERLLRDQQVSQSEDTLLTLYREINTLFGLEDRRQPVSAVDAPPAPETTEPAATTPVVSTLQPRESKSQGPERLQEQEETGPDAPPPGRSALQEPKTGPMFFRVKQEVEQASVESASLHLEDGEDPQPISDILVDTPMQDYGTVDTEETTRVLLSHVFEGRYPYAYWIALAQEQQGQIPVIPSWLLAGIQGAHWFMAQWYDGAPGLLNEINQHVDPKNRTITSEQSLLALSLALGAGLLQSGAGWESWLSADIPSSAPEINTLLNEVDAFTQGGNKLEPAIVQNVLGKEKVEERIKDLAGQAFIWLDSAPQKGTRFPGADDVWKRIVGSKGTLHTWFDYVAQDNRSSVQIVREELQNWNDRVWLDNYIQKLNREKRGGAKPIDGGARDQLINWLLKAAEIARQWSDLIIETNMEVGKKRWTWEQTTHLCNFLKTNLPKSIQEAQLLQLQSGSAIDRVGYAVLETTLKLMSKNLGIVVGKIESPNSFRDTHTLQENLAGILIYYPELSLKDDGTPESRFTEKDLSALVKAEHSSQDAFDLWLSAKNYCFLDVLASTMPQLQQDDARRRMDDQLLNDLRWIESELDKTTVAVEQALADDLISDQEYVASKSHVESIRKRIKQISSAGSESNKVNYRQLLNGLLEIRVKYESSQNERIKKFRTHWERLKATLPKFIDKETERSTVVSLVEKSFELKDLRAVAEAMAHLDNVATGNEQLVIDLFARTNATYKVMEFNREVLPMVRALDGETLQDLGQKYTQGLPAPRKREVQEALTAWYRLKREESKNLREQNLPLVSAIMHYLGWDVEVGNSISFVPQSPTGFQHWRVMANPRVPSPVPQFGSERRKETSGRTGMYDVVGAWGRPGFDSIEALINHVGKKPFILFYFGRLQPSQRTDLIKLLRRKQHPMVVVDELLLLFLAREYEVRLSTMFDCSLPYSSVNPYTPFATGSVPPEMYFGREDRITGLLDPYGPSIVYGGRQLGKSALLRQAQQKYHDPERGQFAIYEDIRLVGNPFSEKDYRTEIAERLVHALRQGGVLEPSRQTIDIAKLSDMLISQIKSKRWRVILLIDEADMFLEADAGKQFYVVTTLKRVMDQTDRMFKIVFAGLHHVQQFTRTSNQPLAHLGDSGAIKIGPLEPVPAIDLIEKPLRSLGYVFGKPGLEDTSLIAHILSYTNYHPGLLQLFGQSLVEHLNQKTRGHQQPPYSITRSDIEAVYRSSKVREIIKDRFNITLALDERYEAITLSLILEQWDEKNGFDRLFTSEELLKISREHWGAGFGEDIMIFRGFLEEMCGLGVLSSVSFENESPRYRLRSPNLVSLMGNESEILNRLDVISKSQPISQQRKLESYHASIDSYYSPLTYAQERMIMGSSSGVCLVFGAQSTQINNLAGTLRKTAEMIGEWAEIKVSAKTESTLREQLKNLTKQNDKPMIAYRELDGTFDEMVEEVKTAAIFCRHHHNKKIRVVFSLDALNAWKWFQLPPSRRIEVEQAYADVLVTLHRWDKLGIRQLLEQHEPEIPAGDVNIRRIYEATGGWPNLMDQFIDFCRGETDPLPALEKLKGQLKDETFRRRFIADLGLYEQPHIKIFIEKILQELDLNTLNAEEGFDYLFGSDPLQNENTMEFLRRLSVVKTIPYLHIEPVVAKLWYESNQ